LRKKTIDVNNEIKSQNAAKHDKKMINQNTAKHPKKTINQNAAKHDKKQNIKQYN